LLGGLSASAFLSKHWQKQPTLIRAAVPSFVGVVSRPQLFDLAARDDVDSRCVRRVRGRYVVESGPFRVAALKQMPVRDWTLLVHGVNLFVSEADRLLRRFSFIPYARLDDVMVSYAAPGGGVGPHFDSYDVFLLQGPGRRRWRYGRQADLALRPESPLKILRRFVPEHDATLAPGDMLYLPPDIAHDGVAVDECMTYSIGFRAPQNQEIVDAFVDHLRDNVVATGRYADPDLRATSHPGLIGGGMRRKFAKAIDGVRWSSDDVGRFVGGFLTEPKQNVVFTPPPNTSRSKFIALVSRHGVRLDPRTQLLYDDAWIFVNGDTVSPSTHDVASLRRLADCRALSATECSGLSAETHGLLYEWYRHGFLATA
jgi:50S ribosomal protein L16 3-hydroxylase